MASLVHLNYAAIGRILREEMRKPVDELAAQIAAKVKADPEVADDAAGSVDVRSVTTDRAVAIVAITHPAGMALQAKYGVFTKAAAACGYEIHGGGDGLVDYVSKSGHHSRITAKQAANYGGGA